MRISRIAGTEILSFDDLLFVPTPDLTVLVGPNGAGKTNLLRLVDVICRATHYAASNDLDSRRELGVYDDARRAGAPSQRRTSVSLAVDLNAPNERVAVTSFVLAAIVSGLARDAKGSDFGAEAGRLLLDAVPSDIAVDVEPMLHGEINVILGRGSDESTAVTYRFAAGEQSYVIDLTQGMSDVRREGEQWNPGLQVDTVSSRLPANMFVDESGFHFDLPRVLPEAGHLTVFCVDPVNRFPLPAATRQFHETIGIPSDRQPPRSFGFGSVLDMLLRQGVAMLPESRQQPRRTFLIGGDGVSDDPSDLPWRLFHLKNGNATERSAFQRIQETFRELSGGRQFEIHARQMVRGEPPHQEAGLELDLVVQENSRDVPLAFAGTGAWECLALSALLADRKGVVAVLDEPAANLHPTIQRRLLSGLLRSDHEQTIMTTHSPFLVPAGDRAQLGDIVRIDRPRGVSRLHRVDTGAQGVRSAWVKELAESADSRSLLFEAAAILVEGETELGALGSWFESCSTAQSSGGPGQHNIGLHCVGGAKGFRTFFELCHRFAVPWVAICDGASFDWSRGRASHVLWELDAARAGDAGLDAWVAKQAPTATFEQAVEVAKERGILTLATGVGRDEESFEAFVDRVAPKIMAEAIRREPSSKPRQGRYIAERLSCPGAVDRMYSTILAHLGIQRSAG